MNVMAVFAATVVGGVESERPEPVTTAVKAPAVALVTVMVCCTEALPREEFSVIGLGETLRPAAVPPFTVRFTLK